MKDNLTTKRLEDIPQELKNSPQWVCWKPGKPRKNGKTSKLPINPKTGRAAKVDDPSTWGTFEEAQTRFQKYATLHGVGFIFTNGYIGIDLDDCYLESARMKPAAQQVLNLVDSYTETSQSFHGLHIIVKGVKPDDMLCKINTGGGGDSDTASKEHGIDVEVYDKGRFFVMTGNVFESRKQINAVDLKPFYDEFFGTPDPLPPATTPQKETPTIVKNVTGVLSLDDQALVDKASAAHDGNRFARLMSGDTTLNNSHSDADWALCRQLAFWTGGNADQMDRIFRGSGLMREKWDTKHAGTGETYGQLTIKKAIAKTTKFYAPQQPASQPPHPADQGDILSAEPPDPEQEKEPEVKKQFFVDHVTDMGNAQRLVKYYGKRIKFCIDHDTWYVWNKRQWKADSKRDSRVVKFGKKVVEKIYKEAGKAESPERQKELAKWAMKTEEKKRINDMIFLAQSEDEVEIESEELDAEHYFLNVRNGVIDLRTGELKPHDPALLMTKCVPIDYDPNALCPTWDEALMKYMGYVEGDEETEARSLRLYDFLQRAVGYSLTGDTCEQCFFFLYGESGKNGKSTFMNIVSKLLGEYFQHVRIESLLAKKNETIPNDIASLPGVRLVVSSEIPENRKVNETLVKDLTGGDAITARFLRQEWFTFYPIFKLWIFGNDKPIVSPSEAMFRRINLIPFDVEIKPEERDPHFNKKLQAELPGILAWAVQGCKLWQKHGLNPPKEVTDATNAYRDEMDVLTDFLDECCIIEPLSQVTVKALYDEFNRWCISSGKQPIGKQAFNKRLERRVPNIYKRPGNRNATTWFGLGLLSSHQESLKI